MTGIGSVLMNNEAGSVISIIDTAIWPYEIVSSTGFGCLFGRVTGILSPAQGAIFGLVTAITRTFTECIFRQVNHQRSILTQPFFQRAVIIITSSVIGTAVMSYLGTNLQLDDAIRLFLITNAATSIANLILIGGFGYTVLSLSDHS